MLILPANARAVSFLLFETYAPGTRYAIFHLCMSYFSIANRFDSLGFKQNIHHFKDNIWDAFFRKQRVLHDSYSTENCP